MFKEASMGRRIWALFLDSFGAYLVASALEPHDMAKRLLLQTSILFVEISLLTSLKGASFGQSAAKLKVVDFQNGSALSIPRVLFRTLLILLVLPAIFRSGGRCVHDIVARSVVVRYYKESV
jgi:uncharacterized RDD family membrane protein YckC